MKKILPLFIIALIILGIGLVVKRDKGEENSSSKVLGESVLDSTPKEEYSSLLPIEIYYGRVGESKEEMLANLSGIYPEDKLTFFPDPSLGLGSQITLYRATPVEVSDGGQSSTYRTFQNSVGAFLDEKKIEVGEKDQLTFSKDTSIAVNMKIEITRVTETEMKENETIPFKKVYKDDPSMLRGEEKMTQKGASGTKENIYLVRRENGQEVSRKLLSSKVIKEPVDQIILRGTKEIIYGTGPATWYSWISGMTAAHNTLPMGTKVLVTNVANGKSVVVTIVDRGIKGKAIIDLSLDAFRLIANPSVGVIQVKLTAP